MAMWREAADIQTADMLRLPVPEAEKITEVTTPSDFQRDLVADLGERAEAVRNREVEPREDNMLKITSDGRKLALDQRLSDPTLPDDPESKVNACVRNVLQVWRDTEEIKGTQLVFCDRVAIRCYKYVAPRVGGHVAVDAHRGAQVGGVDLRGGEQLIAGDIGHADGGGGTGALVDGGGAAVQGAGGHGHAAASHHAAHQGANQAQGGHLGAGALPLVLPGRLVHGTAGGLNGILPRLVAPVMVAVIHIHRSFSRYRGSFCFRG